MPRGAAPNQQGAWRRDLNGRGSSEILELRAGLERLCEQPAFQSIRALLIEAKDELLGGLTQGPTLEAADYAKQLGVCHGLDALESLMREIRSVADAREAKLNAQTERQRQGMEVVA